MNHAALGYQGAFSAPHQAAAMTGTTILREGGTAMEAMVAAAATIAVVYPHMNGIGGDGFWLIKRPGHPALGISACGHAARLATTSWYHQKGHVQSIPTRGAQAALTVPGTIGGWAQALALCPQEHKISLERLLEDAVHYADQGIAVTLNQHLCTSDKLDGLRDVPGFAEHFLDQTDAPAYGYKLRQPALANTLRQLSQNGLRSYYEGELARIHSNFLEKQGSPLRIDDFNTYQAENVTPLHLASSWGDLYNMPAPTQGVSSLMILGLFDRLSVTHGEGFDHLHGLIEATKQAFILRNKGLGDPNSMESPAQSWLSESQLDQLAQQIHRERALPWPYEPAKGDTIWMGAADRYGNMVSFIQSVFWEFGSGLTCPETGVFFQNRGAGFSLQTGPNQLAPGKRPFHTLNPALAQLEDGRIMAYGTMGGEGQPQTQAALFTRYAHFGTGLQEAITAPRWLLGRTWGNNTTSLKIEDRFPEALVGMLRQAGHEVELLPEYSDLTGHAGAVVSHPSGLLESAVDPRADGSSLAL